MTSKLRVPAITVPGMSLLIRSDTHRVELCPDKDMTGWESIMICQLLLRCWQGVPLPVMEYIRTYGLERHFIINELP